ncbi:MAG TPA: mucoidy inhibitor MuiA family protein [Gammaproteobacteria bacterium]|nr:mucoidy inhibitor MuiA family protein [Gammaproteobacteria bacterium]
MNTSGFLPLFVPAAIRHVLSSSLCILALAASAASAEDVEATLRVDAVKVYPRTAAVTRRGTVSIPAGEHRLIVRGLPDPVDPGSLRVSAGSRAVRLGGVEIEKIVAADFVGDAERALSAKLVTLEDQRAAIQDEIPTAETQLKLIDGLAGVPAHGDDGVLSRSASLPATLSVIASGAADARAKIRAAKIDLRRLDAEIAATKSELDKVRTAKKSTTEVRASVIASAAVTTPISVEYRVNDAAWVWLYEARLDTQDESLSFARQASISQGTGEDWGNAEVTVTTAKPAADAGMPRVASLFLELQNFAAYAASSGVEEIIVTATGLRAPRGGNVREPEEAPRITAESFATEFVAEYRIPGRVSISADRQARVYPVSEEEFEPELLARAVLPAGPDARLEAAFHYDGELPIDAGRVQLYRDGAYIGAAALPLLLPGSDVRVPFGVDERIRIVVRDERTESGTRGIAGRQAVDEQRRRYEITSYHAAALPIEIIDRVPVPKESGIDVKVLDGATPPTERNLDGNEGVYLWRFDGTPRQTQTIRHYYSVRYPSDRELVAKEGN